MKSLRLLICLLTAALLLQGCGNGVNTVEENDKINISISFWEPGAKNELKNAFTEIIDDYKQIHPNVEIELLIQPVQRYTNWIRERQAESNLPTIMYNEKANIINMEKSGLIYRLDDALNTPNEYQNNMMWSEVFDQEKLSFTDDLNGKLGLAIPLSALGLAIYYNKDIYDECSLSVPETWEDFLRNCEVIEHKGVNPIAFMAQKKDSINWLQWAICTNAFGNKFLEDPEINVDNNYVISQYEMANAIHTGAYDVTKEPYRSIYCAYLERVREFSQYAHDALSLDEEGAKEQFINGRAAHIFTGSWDIKNLLKNDELDFRSGIIPFPSFSEDESSYGGGRMTIRTVSCLAITKMKEETDTTPEQEAAIDFLKFLTSKEEYSKYTANTSTIPTVKEIAAKEDYDAFDGTMSPIELFAISEKGNADTVTMRTIAGNIDLDDDSIYAKTAENNRAFSEAYFEKRQQ